MLNTSHLNKFFNVAIVLFAGNWKFKIFVVFKFMFYGVITVLKSANSTDSSETHRHEDCKVHGKNH